MVWLPGELRSLRSRGSFRGVLLRDARGNVIGWYAYFLQAGGVSQLVQLAADARAVDTVLGHALRDADAGGSSRTSWGRWPARAARLSAKLSLTGC